MLIWKLALILPFFILEGFIYNPRVTLLIFYQQFSNQLNFGMWIDFMLLILNVSVNLLICEVTPLYSALCDLSSCCAMFHFLNLSIDEDDVSGKKRPLKISLCSFKLYRVQLASLYFVNCWRFFLQFSSQDCLPVPDCLLCVYVLHKTSQKEVLSLVQGSSIPKCTKQNGMLLQLMFWLL